MTIWEPAVHARFDLPHGTVFVVTCDEGFTREVGGLVRLHDQTWEVVRWDDHRTARSPFNGEKILLKVRPRPS